MADYAMARAEKLQRLSDEAAQIREVANTLRGSRGELSIKGAELLGQAALIDVMLDIATRTDRAS